VLRERASISITPLHQAAGSFGVGRRTLEWMVPRSDPPPETGTQAPENSSDPQATPRGPSWGAMVFLILLAMLVAVAIAWAFITPLLHRRF
jgi:hypothetical protein